MKIAIPTRNNQVDDHFGHCELYTLFTIGENREITKKEILDAPEECGCKSDIASVLKSKGVQIMLAGNMGQGAVNKISSFGITIVRGCKGDVTAVAESYLKGRLTDSGLTCNHHHGDHQSGHSCSDH